MAVTADYQFDYGALTIGDGTDYAVVSVGGFDLPDIRTSDLTLLAGGVYAGRDTKAGRTIELDIEISGSAGSDVIGKVRTFLTAWQSTDTDARLTFRLPGALNRYVNGRPRGVKWRLDLSSTQGLAVVAANFFCPVSTIFNEADNAVVVL